ncbi:MAG: cupin domain-containing protein, partial [Treponema sp.]|nr:cupin domain-containing protein [Treponema sp.]
HFHKRNEEVYIFIKGKGMAYVDGEKIPVTEGDVMRIDPDGKRCFKADDSADLTYICIQAERNSLVQHTKEDGCIVKETPSW